VNISSELHHRRPPGSAFIQLEVQRLCLIKDEIYTGKHFRFLPELTSKQQVLQSALFQLLEFRYGQTKLDNLVCNILSYFNNNKKLLKCTLLGG
jgi:hypothetical protein